jgi:hypothetical protein
VQEQCQQREAVIKGSERTVSDNSGNGSKNGCVGRRSDTKVDELLEKAVGLLEEGRGDTGAEEEDEEAGDENVEDGSGDEPDLLVSTVSLENEKRESNTTYGSSLIRQCPVQQRSFEAAEVEEERNGDVEDARAELEEDEEADDGSDDDFGDLGLEELRG